LSEHWKTNNHTAFQGITLDYYRFTTDNMIRTFCEEKEAIRAHSELPVTTNFMGLYKPLDYHRWAPHLDFASWDNYPPDENSAHRMALAHDLMRGLKDGQPFWVMEQTPSTTASRDVNPVKKPGVLGLWAWQSIAHGADATLYFQMRQNRGACEKYHGAVLNHSGRTDTRVFLEVAELGEQLAALADETLGLRTPARAALIVDWDSWWALEMSDGPNRHLGYVDTILRFYTPLWEAGVLLDVIPVTADLDGYDVVVAPALHLLKGDIATRLVNVARRGGTVISNVMSGRVDANDQAFPEVAPGPLAPLFGIRVDETDARSWDDPVSLSSSLRDPITHAEESPTARAGYLVYDIIQLNGAEPVATYTDDWFKGTPAATRHGIGQGDAWYLGTVFDEATMRTIIHSAIHRHALVSPFAAATGLEHTRRGHIDFLLNHHDAPHRLTMPFAGTDLITNRAYAVGDTVTLNPTDVMVVAREDNESGEEGN
jgi:beta-galactosidase